MKESFYVVAQEHGFGEDALPLWTDRQGEVSPFGDHDIDSVRRVDLTEVPGAFQLLNVLGSDEAEQLVNIAEQLGFHQDAPVSLPHDVRHNDNLNWIVSESIDGEIWRRAAHLVRDTVGNQVARGLNARFRFYRYACGDYFSPHTDGAWPGSRVIDGELVADAYNGRYSQYTYLLFLNDGYQGGRTQFLVSESSPDEPARDRGDVKTVNIRTSKGAALCFPHGMHPLHCVHASEPITSGTKYIIRTDILFDEPVA